MTSRRRHSLFCLTLVAGVFVICLVRLVGFVQENAVNLLFDDQWALLAPLFHGQGPGRCFFLQDGPQRQGLGGFICWFLYWATGWNVRAEVWAEVIVLALATAVAIALAVRLRGRLAWSDAAFPLLLLSLVHWETMTLVTMLAYGILPLLLILLLACAWTAKNFVMRVTWVGILGGLCFFSSYGLCGTVAAMGLALLLWLRPGPEQAKAERRQAALILLCLGGAVAVFAHGYRWEPGVPGWRFPVSNWWDYPRFCALMFTSLLGIRSISMATVAVGAVLFGLVLGAFVQAAVMIWRREATARAKVVWILTGTSLFYAALVAIGRLPTNIQAAFLWRYMTLMTPGVCGLALAAEGWAVSWPRAMQRCMAIGWIALAGMIWSNFLPEQYGAAVAKGKRIWIASYLRTHDLRTANKDADCGIFFPAPEAPWLAERLRWLEQQHLSFFRDADNSRPEESVSVSGR
jgi:hypothetical protein